MLTPASCDFRDVTVWEMPSPTQGPAVLNALRRLDELPPLTGERPDWSPVVEAIIEGMAEAGFDLREIGTAAAGQAMRAAPQQRRPR